MRRHNPFQHSLAFSFFGTRFCSTPTRASADTAAPKPQKSTRTVNKATRDDIAAETKAKAKGWARKAYILTFGTGCGAWFLLYGIYQQDEQVFHRRHKAIAVDIAREKKRAAALGVDVPADDGFGEAYNLSTGQLDPTARKDIDDSRRGYEHHYSNNDTALLQDKPLTLRAGYNAENPEGVDSLDRLMVKGAR